MPPETEYKKGCRRPNHHNSVRGVLPRVVATSSIRKRESQYCTTQYDDCHKGIFCQHVLPPCKEETNIRIATFEREPQVDRNIAWGFCPSGTSRMLNARQPQAPNAILYLLILPATFSF